jgi:RND family efflux transporter MFP subunit
MAFATDAIIGFTEPVKTIELAASETGTLSKLNIKRGDFAGTNQVIGALDSEVLHETREFGIAKQDSQAKLKAARIRLERARSNFDKLQQLRDEGHGGSRELQIAESDYELARTDVEAVEEEMKLAKLEIRRIDAEIRRRQIVSPIDGVVSEIHREVGEYVSANDPNVLTIVDLRQLRVRFYVPTSAAERFNVGDTISIQLLHSQKAQAATIDFIAPVIDADSNTIRVDLLIDNAEQTMRSGRRCELLIETHRPGSTLETQSQTSLGLRLGGGTR